MKKYTFYIVLTVAFISSFFLKAQNTTKEISSTNKVVIIDKNFFEQKRQKQALKLASEKNLQMKTNGAENANGLVIETKPLVNNKYEEPVKEKEHTKPNQSIPTTHFKTPVNKD